MANRDESLLPIEEVLPALRETLARQSAVVLQAPPGAGKTTGVPLALLKEDWLAGGRIVMLEPRRLAARAAARRMSETIGERVGDTIGFRVRGDTRVSTRTRIEVVTEGVLTRMLHADAALDGVGLLVFDEFHERSLHGDVGLALALLTQELLRPELRLLVMSATLDCAAVSTLLGGAPIVTSEGRSFPVTVRHLARREGQHIEDAVASAVRGAVDRDEGSVLAFLPGAGEIRRTAERLGSAPLPRDVHVLPLYGDLAAAAQDAAIRPSAPGERKVVLATSIAETSLTIDGIRVVIDGGLARVPRFAPRIGMTRLETVRVSRASADQRCGRAGRTAPGVCYRLWRAEEHSHLLERSTPEILEADLAPLALDLAQFGIRDPVVLRWLDLPPTAALAQACELLRLLNALDAEDRITAHGRRMAALGLHPRLAHMVLRAHELGRGATACVVAALLEERDIMRRGSAVHDADLRLRVSLVVETPDARQAVDRDAVRRVREQSRKLGALLGVRAREPADPDAVGWVLALAYPDRIAQRRSGTGTRFLLRNGRGAALADAGSLAGAAFLTIAELDGQLPQSRIFLAAPVEWTDVERLYADQITTDDVVEWDASVGTVAAVRRERLGAIVLREVPLRTVDDESVARTIMSALRRAEGLALRWSDGARQLRERLAFLREWDPSWPDVSDAALDRSMEQWLLPRLIGLRRRSEVEALDLGSILLETLDWRQRQVLDELAPTHVVVPTGSRIRVDYGDPRAPVLAVRFQELFGLAETPRIGGGQVPLTLHLLSPARRPVQVTQDLAGFWRSSYFDVRKELRGRYPKHAWPEDPLTAPATRHPKRHADAPRKRR